MFATVGQMHQSHKQECICALNTFQKTVSLLALDLKLIKNGFHFKSTDQQIDFFEKCKLIFGLVSVLYNPTQD